MRKQISRPHGNNVASLPVIKSNLAQMYVRKLGVIILVHERCAEQDAHCMRSVLDERHSLETVYYTTITPNNAEGASRGAGLVLHHLEAILSKLNIKLRTPTPNNTPNQQTLWTSQTPSSPKKAVSQLNSL